MDFEHLRSLIWKQSRACICLWKLKINSMCTQLGPSPLLSNSDLTTCLLLNQIFSQCNIVCIRHKYKRHFWCEQECSWCEFDQMICIRSHHSGPLILCFYFMAVIQISASQLRPIIKIRQMLPNVEWTNHAKTAKQWTLKSNIHSFIIQKYFIK